LYSFFVRRIEHQWYFCYTDFIVFSKEGIRKDRMFGVFFIVLTGLTWQKN